MKIRITDNRGVFIEGVKRRIDEEIVVVKEEGQAAIDKGFAVEVKPRGRTGPKKADDK